LTSARTAYGHAQFLVSRHVAIVVFTIARFRAWQHVTHARAPHASRTRLRSGSTSPNAFSAHWPGVTRLCRTIDARTIFVDYAVAIVVRSVARFFDRSLKGNAIARHAHGTSVNRDLTGADSTGNGPETVIDVAIAIIIGAITNFGDRHYLPFTLAKHAHEIARLCTGQTRAHTDGGRVSLVTGLRIALFA
jgi:hypothetical protein